MKVSETGELVAQNQATISAINDKQILNLAPEGSWVEPGTLKGYVVESGVEQARLAYLEMQARTRSLASVVDARAADVERAESVVKNNERKTYFRERFSTERW